MYYSLCLGIANILSGFTLNNTINIGTIQITVEVRFTDTSFIKSPLLKEYLGFDCLSFLDIKGVLKMSTNTWKVNSPIKLNPLALYFIHVQNSLNKQHFYNLSIKLITHNKVVYENFSFLGYFYNFYTCSSLVLTTTVMFCFI